MFDDDKNMFLYWQVEIRVHLLYQIPWSNIAEGVGVIMDTKDEMGGESIGPDNFKWKKQLILMIIWWCLNVVHLQLKKPLKNVLPDILIMCVELFKKNNNVCWNF